MITKYEHDSKISESKYEVQLSKRQCYGATIQNFMFKFKLAITNSESTNKKSELMYLQCLKGIVLL